MRTIDAVDFIVSALVGVCVFLLGVVILRGMLESRDASLRRNPLAYATICTFWAGAISRTAAGVLAIRGLRVVTLLTLLLDSIVLIGPAGYWVVRLTIHRTVGGKIELFRDRAVERTVRLERLQSALEINDEVVQGLTAAQLALEVGDPAEAHDALKRTLMASRHIVSEILSELRGQGPLNEGDLTIRDRL